MSDRDIIEAIQKIAGRQLDDPVSVVACEVVSVDLSTRTCDCTTISENSAIDIPNVQMMAEVDDGFLLVPSLGSTVFVLYSTRNAPYIVLFSQIDQVVMIVGGSQVIIKDGLLQMHDGSFGGLIRITDLVAKLNNLENKFNDLTAKYNLHTHAGVSVGSGTTAPPIPIEAGTLTPTTREDLENTEVTHGKQLE